MTVRICPNCGEPLKSVVYGLLIDKLPDDCVAGGCACFGDDRDDRYYCPNCKCHFGADLKPISLIPCPLESCGRIKSEECKNYELMQSRYELLHNRELICNEICPALKKRARIQLKDGSVVEGIIVRTWKRAVKCPHEFILVGLTINYMRKGNSIEVPIDEITHIEVLPK